MLYNRFLALGDSMTEGMSDEIFQGKYRGWADRVASVMSENWSDFTYANLAVRGKLVGQVVTEQIPEAKKFIEDTEHLGHHRISPNQTAWTKPIIDFQHPSRVSKKTRP